MIDTWPAPVVTTAGSSNQGAPLVVLLHGRGADERSIIGLTPALPSGPDGPAYAAVRAPISEGGGYAWFANRGIGRPVAASLRATMDWFRRWLDEAAPAGRPVLLVGFSGGAAFAGGLALDDPARYAGLAVSHGTLPFDAGLDVTPGRLAHLPVYVAQGEHDQVIPAELLSATWRYLLSDSGAPTVAHRDAGGHGMSAEAVAVLARWISDRTRWLERRDSPTPGPRTSTPWPTTGLPLPTRRGPRPEVTWSIPQQQLTDNAPLPLQDRLASAVGGLAGVQVAPSRISVPGARAFLAERGAQLDEDAFLVPEAGEFAHLHPGHDGSLHLALPADLATEVVVRGWGQMHPLAGTRLNPGFVMVYGPRDDDELAVVLDIVGASHSRAVPTAVAP